MKDKHYTSILILIIFIWLIGCATVGVRNIRIEKQVQEDHEAALQSMHELEHQYANISTELAEAKDELNTLYLQLQNAKDELAKSEEQNKQQLNNIEDLNQTIKQLEELLLNDNELPLSSVSESDVYLIVNTVWGEAGICSKIEQSAVIWCILNRVDAGYGTIKEVITAPNQFYGYRDWLSPDDIKTYDELRALTIDVLLRWQMEKAGCTDIGRTLPKEYLWFYGDGERNHFRNALNGDYDVWDWNCWNPYE